MEDMNGEFTHLGQCFQNSKMKLLYYFENISTMHM
jgi:hypothetical protein